jgi:tetratricopeptide (TPR) repeat protein
MVAAVMADWKRLGGGIAAWMVVLTGAAPLAAQPSGHQRMIALLQQIAERTPNEHLYLGDRKAREMRARVEAAGPDAPDYVLFELYLELGEAEQYVGREQEAIHYLERAYALLPGLQNDLAANWIGRLKFALGVAYLRFGETTNCTLNHAAESCLLPITGNGVHVLKQPSQRAVAYFTEVLEHDPPGSKAYISARWLLNIAYMTIGGYPDDVPAAYLIPPRALESDEPFPRFENVAHHAGLARLTLSGSVVVEDFDTDGFLDLLVSSYDPTEQLRLFRNDEDGTFTDVTPGAGIAGLTGGLNMVQADYDDDGDMDVLVLRGAWLEQGGRHPNSLLRNNGDGTFTDVTFEAGLGEVHLPTQTASWADYDNDGDVDLYIGNETNGGLTAPGQLFQSQGDGTFVDVAPAAGVTNGKFAKAVVWGDYDQDRYPDLFVSNLDGANRLYRNQRDGSFEDVAPSLGITEPGPSFPAWFWDYDNDGVLDLFVSGYDALIDDVARAYLGEPFDARLPRLYRGNGNGGFVDMAASTGLVSPSAPMGSNFGDVDGDGFMDFYLGTGYPPYHALMPNRMYWNRNGERFADVTTAGGFGHLQKGHGVALVDVDNDGDQDVFEQMGGALAGDKYFDSLYLNPGFDHHHLIVELSGIQSKRAAIGARIRVDIASAGGNRSVYKHVNSGGTFGANSIQRQFIGLGNAARIERFSIYWPTTDRAQTFVDVPLDRTIQILEGVDSFRILR